MDHTCSRINRAIGEIDRDTVGRIKIVELTISISDQRVVTSTPAEVVEGALRARVGADARETSCVIDIIEGRTANVFHGPERVGANPPGGSVYATSREM